MTILKRHLYESISKEELSNIILFSIGKFVSLLGTYIYTFAIGLYVLKLTGSGLSFATTLVLNTIPIVIINPIAGVLADRLNKKVLVVLMDILNGILLIGVYFLSSIYGLNLTMIYISTFVMTSFMTIFNTSIEAAKPNMVSKERIMGINSISKIVYSTSMVLGPMIGGLVFAFVDIRMFIICNGVSFIIAAILEFFINFRFNYREKVEDREKSKIDFFKDMKQGFQYLMDEKEILRLLMVFVCINFSMGISISVPLPLIINNILSLSSRYFGIIQGFFPIGLIVGAVFIGRVSKYLPYKKLLLLMSFIISGCIALIGVPAVLFNIIKGSTTLLVYYCIVMFITGISIAFIDIPIMSILQKSIPDEYRGRVLSLSMGLSKIILPLAFIISGVLVNIVPLYMLQIFGSLILSVSSIIAMKD